MGWFAVSEALKNGVGPYGTTKESLKGESDQTRTMSVALYQLELQQKSGYFVPDRNAKIRIRYWAKRFRME